MRDQVRESGVILKCVETTAAKTPPLKNWAIAYKRSLHYGSAGNVHTHDNL